ncbi:MAG TPA: penicillin acylase family protein [Streptosporangiaceae bacterium]|nr:penicillin acylase family protein [Streptosporangiaceae bacterium]
MLNQPLWRLVRQVANVIAATVAVLVVLVLCAAGFHQLPALGRALDPGHGAWLSAAGGQLPTTQKLTLPGLNRAAAVSFDSHGVASIDAASETDAVLALGYLHASLRLTQMDTERRMAEGALAQLDGPSAVPSDEFELRLGLMRTAEREWAGLPKTGAAAQLLVSYAQGVNDYLAQVRRSGRWPAKYSLAGVYPSDWTPVDSLAIQGALTQELDFTTTPLDNAVLARSLGLGRTAGWFAGAQPSQPAPYDPGPYHLQGIVPVGTSMTTAVPQHKHNKRAVKKQPHSHRVPGGPGTPVLPSAAVASAASSVLAQTSVLPDGQLQRYPGGDAWVANGQKVFGGGAMLAGDPLLARTLPSAWFEVALSAPGYNVSGVGIPGLPGVLIGHNQAIAWSLSGAGSQSALYYAEKTASSRPGEYFWHGRWRTMHRLSYTIAVRGQAPRQLTVEETVHGPVLADTAGQAISVDWMGNVPSPDVTVLQQIGVARNFKQFTAALAGWRAPAGTFAYADRHGNIGAIAAGYYPVIGHGAPWLPLDGTGSDDVAGVIPYRAVPQAYDPRSHLIVAAGQRPVTAAYPYSLRTGSFDPGYRAGRELAFLTRRSHLKVSDYAALQTSEVDELAEHLVPRVRAMLARAPLTPLQQQAAGLLKGWDYSMDQNSAAAAVWGMLWSDYLTATFAPWWQSAQVPTSLDPAGLAVTPSQLSLDSKLEHWTLADQANPAFSPPGHPAGTAASVLRSAFATAVASLHAKLGGSPASWTWGKLQASKIPALLSATGLGYGPVPSGGDPWTVNTATAALTREHDSPEPPALPVTTAGPSWRMIVRWSGRPGKRHVVATGIYPGGQAENPASPWYQNLIADWSAGSYLTLPSAGPPSSQRPAGREGSPGQAPERTAGQIRWELVP